MNTIQIRKLMSGIMCRVLPLSLLMAFGAEGAEIKITTGRLGALDTVSIENSLVRVRLVLSRGASIDEYVLKSTGHNQLSSNASQLKGLTNNETEFKEGGYVEIMGPSDGWPGPPIWRQPFQYVIKKEKSRPYIECTAVEPETEIRITRKVELFPKSTEMRITVNAQNISSGSTYCWVCAHSRMAVGGGPSGGDVLIYPDVETEQYKQMNFIRKQDMWHDFGSWGKWFGVIDPIAHETLIKINSPDGLVQAGVWFGDDYVPQFRWGKRLNPNESLVFQERYFIVKDLPTIEAVSDKVVLSMKMNKNMFGSEEPAEIMVAIGRPQATSPQQGTLVIKSGEKAVETIEFPIGGIKSDCPAASKVTWNTKDHPDGKYQACFKMAGEIDYEIPFEINRGKVDPVKTKLVAVKDRIKQCRPSSGTKALKHSVCLKGYLYALEWLAFYLDKAYYDGSYPKAEKLISQIEDILNRTEREFGQKDVKVS